MKLTLGVMAAVAAIAVAGDGGGAGQNRLQTILDRGHIIVGTGSTNPPWHFKDDAGDADRLRRRHGAPPRQGDLR